MREMDLINIFNDGVSDSGILFILVLIDTTLAVTYQIKSGGKLLSSAMISGLLRNFVLCFMPGLVHILAIYHPRTDGIYQLISAVLSLYIGFAILQSIMAYTDLWGVKYPDWINNWLSGEIKDKVEKGDNKK